MNGKRFTAVSLAVVLGISVAACGKTEEPEEAGAVSVEVETPKIGELTVDTAYIGMAAPQEQVYVIPKASGTVTETFFGVGDTVQEGDVLFKIDDEAAQLQIDSARASYASAQAGVTAQNGGARHLQNVQTEEQIRQLRESLSDTDEQINDLEDQLDDMEDSEDGLKSRLSKTQGQLAEAQNAYAAAESALTPQIEALQLSIAESQKQINENQQELADLQKQLVDMGTSGAVPNTELPGEGTSDSSVVDTDDPTAGEGKNPQEIQNRIEELQSDIESRTKDIGNWQGELAPLSSQLTTGKAAVEQLQGAVNQMQTALANISPGKSQLESGIDQLESGQDTIRDNLAMAEQAYGITQNEVYPQTDAVSAAQLHAASIGIDSAQMQLDFYTVKSPISGIVESVSVEKNGMAAAGNPAYIISNKESMTVTFQVAEKAKNVLAVGDHVVVEREGTEYDGVITEIGTMANQQTKLFQVKATVTGAGASLPNGVSVKVYATTQRESEKLVVPYDSVYFSAGNAYVYCVENNQIVKTDVTVGLMNDTEVAIEEGLTEDSLVVSNWSSKLRNGVEVEIVSMNGEEVINQTSSEEEEPQESEEAEESEEEPASDTDMTEEAE